MKFRIFIFNYHKRIFDLLLSGLGLVILSPVFLILALMVRVNSPGPAIFKQERVGLNKKIFTLLKFRTMRTDAPSETPTHLLADPDSCITGVGKFLRRTSLDELPQLWNILKGDMSVIGPRPALWNQYDLIAERDKYGANKVRPGLTGLAQIRGRDMLSISEKAAYDGEYYRNIGFVMDCRVLWETIAVVLSGKDVVQ